MTPQEHYDKALLLLSRSRSAHPPETGPTLLAQSQIHATLALYTPDEVVEAAAAEADLDPALREPIVVCCPDCGQKASATVITGSVEPRRSLSGRVQHLQVTASGIAPHRCAKRGSTS